MSSALVEHETRVDTAPKANILLVDDNPIKLSALESALAGLEQHVSKARSADRGVTLSRASGLCSDSARRQYAWDGWL